jgi:hypothetical protein
VHDRTDSASLYALLLHHFHSRPRLLDRLHALLERARSRHEPLATTLWRAEERLLMLSPASPHSKEGGGEEEEVSAVAVAAALGAVRELLGELRALARERPASEVAMRYLEATGA